MDAETAKLFPEVNPNIDEIIEREKAVDPNNVIVEDKLNADLEVKEKTGHKDIFVKKKKVQFKDDGEKNVKIEVEEKPKKYSHLAAARQKGIETRRRKAAEKRAAKEAEKAKKAEERAARKAATMERNRQKARERYYKNKQNKKEIPKKIIEDTKPRGVINKMQQAQNQNNMDFNTFAKYMMKYEQMKEAYNTQKKKAIEKKAEKNVKKKMPTNSYNSPNYPLAHLYNPNLRNSNQYF
tara:strand:- start:4792 stop:5505 length:714 start_codon:yes stop_codon:yes gene_type:complete